MLDPATPLSDGTYYRWRGGTYVGAVRSPQTVALLSTDQEEGFSPRRLGRGFEREVPRPEVEVLTLSTVATWRGRQWTVLARTGEQLVLAVPTQLQQEALAMGAQQVDRGVVNLTVPTSEVTDLAQVRTTA